MLNLKELQLEGAAAMADVEALMGKPMSAEEMVRVFSMVIGQAGMDVYTSVLKCCEEADACRAAGAWFSTFLMMAAAIEGLLCLCALLFKSEVENSKIYQGLRHGTSFQDRVLNANFDKLIKLAEELNWLAHGQVDPELWIAVQQDLPKVLKNLFPEETEEKQKIRAKSFELKPALEMLRLMQHLRNLVHSSRTGRFGVDLKGSEFEDDCKFGFITGFQIMSLLFNTIMVASKARLKRVAALRENFGEDGFGYLQNQARQLIEESSVRFPPQLTRSIEEARAIRDTEKK